ncbi:MAG: tRNA glutamyl-Q(34) synthetase GluQRS [Burkholderiaceae bacterium]|nr:MAG: tRNA glutamyl-Q(34) synthetase GluQRS [Burkholderiaceae bacterium]
MEQKRSSTGYVGRFAPSPTGPLHFGSLVTALGSYLDARLHQGQWLLRIEDIDTPRCQPEATENILNALLALGMQWDGPIVYQSLRTSAYQMAFDVLLAEDRVYGCCCTRKEIADSLLPQQHADTPVYPGTCRQGLPPGKEARAWRMRTNDTPIHWCDFAYGKQQETLAQTVGDFVLKRADGLWAYQLAVVVDDAETGITHIVRGADLMTSTARQVYLQHSLQYPTPQYWHLPLVLAEDGEKLSKQNGAQALDMRHPIKLLNRALEHFGLAPVRARKLENFWPRALEQWAMYRSAVGGWL